MIGTILIAALLGLAAAPHVEIKRLECPRDPASYNLTPKIVQRYVRLRRKSIRHCYTRALRRAPGLETTVIAKFVINGDGSVVSAQVHGSQGELASCVEDVVRTIRFPDHGRATARDLLHVRYPFHFRKRVSSTHDASGEGGPGSKLANTELQLGAWRRWPHSAYLMSNQKRRQLLLQKIEKDGCRWAVTDRIPLSPWSCGVTARDLRRPKLRK